MLHTITYRQSLNLNKLEDLGVNFLKMRFSLRLAFLFFMELTIFFIGNLDGSRSLWRFSCTLQCLSNSLSHGEHTSSSVLTIAWKDSVKTTLGWYLTRLRGIVWLCRKEIATAFVYVWLMKGIFTLSPSAAKDFLPFTFPWQGLFNPSAGFVIAKRGSIFPITGLSLPRCDL